MVVAACSSSRCCHHHLIHVHSAHLIPSVCSVQSKHSKPIDSICACETARKNAVSKEQGNKSHPHNNLPICVFMFVNEPVSIFFACSLRSLAILLLCNFVVMVAAVCTVCIPIQRTFFCSLFSSFIGRMVQTSSLTCIQREHKQGCKCGQSVYTRKDEQPERTHSPSHRIGHIASAENAREKNAKQNFRTEYRTPRIRERVKPWSWGAYQMRFAA